MSICINLIRLAADEGKQSATKVAEEWISCLEQIGECGSEAERRAASILLGSVRLAVHEILTTNAVAIAIDHTSKMVLENHVP